MRPFLLPATVLALAVIPSVASAQTDFKATRESTVKFGGTLGAILRFAGGSKPQEEVTSISASGQLRSDRGESSTITDWAAARLVSMDHKRKTYYTMDMNEALELAASMAAQQPQAGATPPPSAEPSDVEYKLDLSVERNAGRQELLGHQATAVQIRVDAIPIRSATVPLDSLPRFAMLSRIWTAADFPGNAAQKRMAEAAAENLSKALKAQPGVTALAQAFQASPAFKAAFDERDKALVELEGMALDQKTVFVTLPPGVELDIEAAFSAEVAPAIKIDAGKVAGNAAKSAISGRLGRLGLGKKKQEEAAPVAAEPLVQAIIVRIEDRITSYGTEDLPDAWFAGAPSNYKQVESPLERFRKTQR